MKIIPIKTRLFNPPKDDIYNVIDNYCPALKEKDIFIITSKVLAIHQGRCLAVDSIKNKNDLIKKEADFFYKNSKQKDKDILLTIKNKTIIPFAGIDESNGDGYYILWPQNPSKEAKKICNYLKKRCSLKNLAVIITDSFLLPMRYGVVGISIGFYGINPLRDYRNKKDLFGKKIKMSQTNIVDSIASLGVISMGEGNEQTPFVIVRALKDIMFTKKEMHKELFISEKEDVYYELINKFN